MSKSGEINAESLLRIVRCTRCGYSLEGLPPSGRCPECGLVYSPDRLVLFGRAQGGNKTIDGKISLISFLYFLAIAVYIVVDRFVGRRYSGMLQALLAVSIFGGAMWRRHVLRRDMPAESQVHLSPAGFGCRDGLGDVTITPWQPTHRVRVRALLREHYRLQIRTSGRWWFLCSDLLDFVFPADEPTAARVAERIEQFREGVKVERDFCLNELVR